jgi:hypothetical protein
LFERHAGRIWKLSELAGTPSIRRSIERAFEEFDYPSIPDQQEPAMSAATEFAPVVYIPESARTCPAQRLATVTQLYRPSERTVAPPVRLTRRGVVVLAAAVAVLASALMLLAWLSAPASAGGSGAGAASVPAHITVRPGDTLWSIATRVAPNRDPLAEVADLKQWNSLGTGPLIPGQVLRTR